MNTTQTTQTTVTNATVTNTNTTNTTTTNTSTINATTSTYRQFTTNITHKQVMLKRIITLTLVVLSLFGSVCLFSGCSKDDDITVTTVENGEVVVKKIKKEDLVVMPNVVGMNKDEAVKTLEDLGLVVEPHATTIKRNYNIEKLTDEEYNQKSDLEKKEIDSIKQFQSNASNLIVCDQTPENTVVQKGSTVEISFFCFRE